ncbi:TPA: hypothetical protein MIO72_09360 [Klebsiella pneumoniae subsp. pneumoniae]|uniref:hypothetical protein n=1 Tax=Klebsiella TaxID=570 RepID=UPI000D4D9A64|nr:MULTISPECIES: hypothetical protein [Klebsiella]HBY0545058.1 hypothetical protein [Klebsiella pneumoniae subsp. pneumoniae]EIW9067474.1 hypothetical protein [Klebsiella pneumoniae]EIW9159116.1 hypothetical protein [Klebsiella pneumoniae]EIW9170291.1 hypothetical protein [Klebsiella pneumoniae]EJA1232734.1 hypothetical protein [Klebsiella pneumoniae]
MNTKRFELALERLKPSDWREFEKLASAFLASEFDVYISTAANSGDGGRDGELYSTDDPKVMAQFSVTDDWNKKINDTIRRLNVTFPDTLVLIYMSNQEIGALGDSLKKTARKNHNISLDIRDKNWFCERVNLNQSNQIKAEELAKGFVDPYLATYDIIPKVSTELSNPESIAALTYLNLQWQDDIRDKGLTKTAFEAMVRSALIGTDSNNRMKKDEICSKIFKIFPRHSPQELSIYIDKAIKRLGKTVIKSHPNNEYCLSHEDTLRFNEFKAEKIIAESELKSAIEKITLQVTANSLDENEVKELSLCLRNLTEKVLFERSQSFAMAVESGNLTALADNDFKTTIMQEISISKFKKKKDVDWFSILNIGIRETLLSDNPSIQQHLRSLADSYTLMAFLQITPDVQKAVEKMFSNGNLWLDTTIILPLISETLLNDEEKTGRFTRMIAAATGAGLRLYVTDGVIEEVERHMNRCLTCSRMPSRAWNGSIPYLLERYIFSGRSVGSFATWLENFRGPSRPMDDIFDYLLQEFNIHKRSLQDEYPKTSEELRRALVLIWNERYVRRREKYNVDIDEMTITRLINHDIECYAGVLALRNQERSSPFGYSSWWLTLDKQTFDLKRKLQDMMTETPPDSPVMSADFLVNYLAIGPLRRKVSKADEANLPLLMMIDNATKLTPELVVEAENIRKQFIDLPERMIRRNVRDSLDKAKSYIGPLSKAGMESGLDDFADLRLTQNSDI